MSPTEGTASLRELCFVWENLTPDVLGDLVADTPGSAFVPLSPLSLGALSRAGIDVMPTLRWWRFISEERFAAQLADTDALYARLAARIETLYPTMPDALQRLPLAQLDRPILWLASQYLNHYDAIFEGIQRALPQLERLHFPTLEPMWDDLVVDSNLPLAAARIRQAANRGAIVTHLVRQPAPPVPPPPRELLFDADRVIAAPWLAVHGLGIPELPLRLRELARDGGSEILLILDQHLSGRLETIYGIASETNNIRILPLFGADFDRRRADAAALIDAVALQQSLNTASLAAGEHDL